MRRDLKTQPAKAGIKQLPTFPSLRFRAFQSATIYISQSITNPKRCTLYCKKCGTDAGDAKYCPNCGESIEDEAKSGITIEPGQKTVNKIAYGVIAILIGDFGIHRFYAGKWLSGILYLLFFWTFIPGLLGLVEGIIALVKEDDGHGNIPVYKDKFFV